MFLEKFFKKEKKLNEIDEVISVERGYVLCGRIHGPKGTRFVEAHRTGKELKKFLPQLSKEVGVSPLEVLRQLSVDEAFLINGVMREI